MESLLWEKFLLYSKSGKWDIFVPEIIIFELYLWMFLLVFFFKIVPDDRYLKIGQSDGVWG